MEAEPDEEDVFSAAAVEVEVGVEVEVSAVAVRSEQKRAGSLSRVPGPLRYVASARPDGYRVDAHTLQQHR